MRRSSLATRPLGTRPHSKPSPSAARSSSTHLVTPEPRLGSGARVPLCPSRDSGDPPLGPRGGCARTIRGCSIPRRPARPESRACRTSFRHTRGGQFEALVRGARDLAVPGRHVRDHRRRRRLEGRDAGPCRRVGGAPPRIVRAVHHRPIWVTGRPSVRVRCRAIRPRGVYRRRPPVQGRRHRPPDRPDRGGGRPRCRGRFRINARIRSCGRSTRGISTRQPVFFGLKVTDVDCACKLFRREALDGLRVESGGAFFSAEMIIKLRAAGRTVVEVGVPHYPRTAGSATGARPRVVLRAVRDFWSLRLRLGEPVPRSAPRRTDDRPGCALAGQAWPLSPAPAAPEIRRDDRPLSPPSGTRTLVAGAQRFEWKPLVWSGRLGKY